VHGVQWIKGEEGKPGTIVFPDRFSGKIDTEVTFLNLKLLNLTLFRLLPLVI
jgi:hypothetical protein